MKLPHSVLEKSVFSPSLHFVANAFLKLRRNFCSPALGLDAKATLVNIPAKGGSWQLSAREKGLASKTSRKHNTWQWLVGLLAMTR